MKFIKISDSLDNLRYLDDEKISIEQILQDNHDNLYFVLFFMMALSLIPTPGPIPFISNFCGILGSLISFSLIRGKKTVYMPKFIARMAIAKRILGKIIEKINPIFIKIENGTRKRITFLNGKKSLRFLNWFIFLLSLDLIVPIPILTFMPSIAVILIVFGLLNDDGLITAAGILLGLLSLLTTVKIWLWGKALVAKLATK
ncbi:MAG: exopolysaccharide biosynthesis protein [Rickettsiales bacterium]|jgi:hypothetical protein|nr:exopolysaccharide biosynthesis protein [Rickettsiales bacterium]